MGCCRIVPRAASWKPNGARSLRSPTTSAGFTLGELAHSMAIVGVTLTIAVPVLSNIYMNVRVKAVASEFAATLRYARAQAVALGSPVQVVPGGSHGWTDGWMVKSRSQRLLGQVGPLRVSIAGTVSDGLTYGSRGILTKAGAQAFLIHAPDYRWVQARCVYVRPDGRPIVQPHNPGDPSCSQG
jgi:Tfp pilus assembly protein FimT